MEIEGYASKEEVWFSYYVSELKNRGYITEAIYQPKEFLLAPETHLEARMEVKNEVVDKDIKLTNEHVYTADWKLYWSDKAKGLFFWEKNGTYKNNFFPFRKANKNNFIPFFADNNISYIDVKGVFAGKNNTSAITFPINQKWVLRRYGVFVQKVVVSLDTKGLFRRTFTPRIVITEEVYKKKTEDKEVGDSKLKYEPVLIEQFIK